MPTGSVSPAIGSDRPSARFAMPVKKSRYLNANSSPRSSATAAASTARLPFRPASSRPASQFTAAAPSIRSACPGEPNA